VVRGAPEESTRGPVQLSNPEFTMGGEAEYRVKGLDVGNSPQGKRKLSAMGGMSKSVQAMREGVLLGDHEKLSPERT
jgi:hypothetical protein